ncbi:MAG: hypothetical protein V1743_02020 [Nanoarchaeota archaeon]
MYIIYEPITVSLEKKANSFVGAKDFDPAASDRIITQLLSDVKEYERMRNPSIVISRENDRITSASLETMPSMVHCAVTYVPMQGNHGGIIKAELIFLSDDPFDRSEYSSLKRILYSCLRD